MKPRIYIAFLSTTLLLFLGCSTGKRAAREHSVVKEAYHNLTARYNGYFHAKLKLKSGLKNLQTSFSDNYEEVLAVYPESAIGDASMVYPDMDAVITKSSDVIQVHEISKWVDDCWLVMGQAQYLKKEYDQAIETFQYISGEFKDGVVIKGSGKKKNYKKRKPTKRKPTRKPSSSKKKKKKPPPKKKKYKKKKPSKKKPTKKPSSSSKSKSDDKPASASKSSSKSASKKSDDATDEEEEEMEDEDKDRLAFIKHQPIRDDAVLWLTKTLIELKRYEESEAVITLLESEEYYKFDRRHKAEFRVLEAYHYLEQNQYENAIEPLTKAIDVTRSKKKRTRYHYILAQLYQLLENNAEAMTHFQAVLKGNPPYEMEFYAKINIARTFESTGDVSINEVKQLLKKMLRDDKNEEYFDQIYYTLAEISLKEQDKPLAIDYLKKSVAASINNNKQKALSYLRLAELAFAEEKYLPAKYYYDSTLTVLPKEHKAYPEVEKRSAVLQDLVRDIEIINRQDSLLKLAGLPKSELDGILDDLVAKQREKEAQDSLDVQQANQNIRENDAASALSTSRRGGGTWYFYNPAAKGSGFTEFKQKWGSRKLEDNWRRSNKRSLDFDEGGQDGGDGEEAIAKGLDDQELKKKLLEKLPRTPEAKEEAEGKIVEAYYDMANIYRDKLDNDPKAMDTYEELYRRFPNCKYKNEVLYNLYLLNQQAGNTAKANQYKNLLKQNDSESVFAKLADNPDFLKESKKEQEELNKFYAATYDMYLQDRFAEVLQRKLQAEQKYEENHLQPKFDFLEALVIGKTKDREAFKKALHDVIAKHPKDEVKDKAEEILKYLDNVGKPSGPDKSADLVDANSPFKEDENAMHYLMIIVYDENYQLQPIMNKIGDYNAKYHSPKRLKLSKMVLGKDNFLLIRKLDNKEKALTYHTELTGKKSIFAELPKGQYDTFVISDKNYSELLRNKNTAQYKEFFTNNYLKK